MLCGDAASNPWRTFSIPGATSCLRPFTHNSLALLSVPPPVARPLNHLSLAYGVYSETVRVQLSLRRIQTMSTSSSVAWSMILCIHPTLKRGGGGTPLCDCLSLRYCLFCGVSYFSVYHLSPWSPLVFYQLSFRLMLRG